MILNDFCLCSQCTDHKNKHVKLSPKQQSTEIIDDVHWVEIPTTATTTTFDSESSSILYGRTVVEDNDKSDDCKEMNDCREGTTQSNNAWYYSTVSSDATKLAEKKTKIPASSAGNSDGDKHRRYSRNALNRCSRLLEYKRRQQLDNFPLSSSSRYCTITDEDDIEGVNIGANGRDNIIYENLDYSRKNILEMHHPSDAPPKIYRHRSVGQPQRYLSGFSNSANFYENIDPNAMAARQYPLFSQSFVKDERRCPRKLRRASDVDECGNASLLHRSKLPPRRKYREVSLQVNIILIPKCADKAVMTVPNDNGDHNRKQFESSKMNHLYHQQHMLNNQDTFSTSSKCCQTDLQMTRSFFCDMSDAIATSSIKR
ncbi:hypothetical protein GJ496_008421 [Pomphorhynchus laevis]|nr:hypothetical protein GJ496_008421 [Pomphorhynchus laevis]